MEITVATPADIEAIMAIERRPGFEFLVGRSSFDQHAEEMAKPSVRYLLIGGGDEVAGLALLQRVGEADGRVHIKRIAVTEPGQGTGSRLLAGALEWVFANTDAIRIDLDVFTDNARARRVYQKAGFKTEGRLRQYHRSADGTIFDAWMMSILRHEWEQARRQACG